MSTPEPSQRIKVLLSAALERPANERSAFLNQACGGDQSIRAEVESLIRAREDRDPAFLGDSAHKLMEETLDIVGCLEREGYCCIETCCVLKSALRDATNAFLATLDHYTLEDLVRPRRALARLLEIAPNSAGAYR